MMGSRQSGSEFVVLSNVSKMYGSFQALYDVSFSLGEGEIFGYVGPNGAGKTTTMKILTGLITDFRGDVSIDGNALPKQIRKVQKLLGYLPQSVAFQEWRTVDNALSIFGKLSGLSNAEIEDRIPKILDLISLSDVRYKKISQLSGGVNQKVGLAQALIHDPKLLVLDEPLGGLDPLSRRQFKDIMLELGRKGHTILFSSHILSDVQDVADRIGILNNGRIKQVGTLDELRLRLSPQDVIEIALVEVFDEWQGLKSIEGVKEVTLPEPGRILVILNRGASIDQVTAGALRFLEGSGGRIRSIRPISPSLEEIYLGYVEEGKDR